MLISPPRFKFSSPEAIGAMDGHAKLLLYLLNSKWQSTANALWCFTLRCLCLYYSFRHKYAGDFNSRYACFCCTSSCSCSRLWTSICIWRASLMCIDLIKFNLWNASPLKIWEERWQLTNLAWFLPVYYLGLHVQMTSWWSIPFAWFVCSCSAA